MKLVEYVKNMKTDACELMENVRTIFNRKAKKSKAQSLIEYALILAMVTVIAITALQLLGGKMATSLQRSVDTVGAGGDQVQSQACESFGGKWKDGKCDTGEGGSGGGESGGGSGGEEGEEE